MLPQSDSSSSQEKHNLDNCKSNSIFLTQNSESAVHANSEQITYTTVLDSIPKDKTETPIPDWRSKFKTEWRWRFLKLPNDRRTVEISNTSSDSNIRQYFNRDGEWVVRDVPEVYDMFVHQIFYCYTN